MRLADPTWTVTTENGDVLASCYHRENAITEARARARIMQEPMRVKQMTDAGLIVRATVQPEPTARRYAARASCPDCGRPITLQPSGWWSHDGLHGECWRVSMDGPNV